MAWERVWKLDLASLDLAAIRAAAEQAAAAYAGVHVDVEREDDDTITCFFSVPAADPDAAPPGGASDDDDDDDDPFEVEISLYDLGREGRLLSLEGDAADNDAAFDDACQLAEDMVDSIGGHPVDL